MHKKDSLVHILFYKEYNKIEVGEKTMIETTQTSKLQAGLIKVLHVKIVIRG